ncbi:hypothetical protein [Cohnella yongneupensis]|uniref:Secreted protein n=1 Tax=Cohnella yongneupensis TaxID=425006 RepID=A0ABW0R1M8_9BACL
MSNKKKALTLGGVFILGVLGGSALMYNDSVYHSVQDALGKGATQNAVGAVNGVGGMTQVEVSSMDLETAMMAVQSQRAQLLETQLKDQIASVQAKNDQISKINNALNELNSQLATLPSDAKADSPLTLSANAASALTAAGLNYTAPKNKGELAGLIQQIKSQVDAMSNSQQMDMLRIQSLSNKRNEAFDIMTNFIKKMADSRSSIIGNMR